MTKKKIPLSLFTCPLFILLPGLWYVSWGLVKGLKWKLVTVAAAFRMFLSLLCPTPSHWLRKPPLIFQTCQLACEVFMVTNLVVQFASNCKSRVNHRHVSLCGPSSWTMQYLPHFLIFTCQEKNRGAVKLCTELHQNCMCHTVKPFPSQWLLRVKQTNKNYLKTWGGYLSKILPNRL